MSDLVPLPGTTWYQTKEQAEEYVTYLQNTIKEQQKLMQEAADTLFGVFYEDCGTYKSIDDIIKRLERKK